MIAASMPKIAAEWQSFDQLSPNALYEMLRFRQQIFVVEQRSAFADLDGLDQRARHLLLRADGALVGYLRLLPGVGEVRIGRVAVAPELRGRGVGRRLMGEALARCRADHPGERVTLAAQLHLRRFYESLGFAAVAAPFDDAGVMHIEMRRAAGPL
jgi:ElaA protein